MRDILLQNAVLVVLHNKKYIQFIKHFIYLHNNKNKVQLISLFEIILLVITTDHYGTTYLSLKYIVSQLSSIILL